MSLSTVNLVSIVNQPRLCQNQIHSKILQKMSYIIFIVTLWTVMIRWWRVGMNRGKRSVEKRWKSF